MTIDALEEHSKEYLAFRTEGPEADRHRMILSVCKLARRVKWVAEHGNLSSSMTVNNMLEEVFGDDGQSNNQQSFQGNQNQYAGGNQESSLDDIPF